ncbi:MAG: SRPBCC family protein [Haloechinothrix sp.]
MTTFQLTVDVERPVRAVYHQWTQFESFPHFMAGVDRVVAQTDTRAHWETSIASCSAASRRPRSFHGLHRKPGERDRAVAG